MQIRRNNSILLGIYFLLTILYAALRADTTSFLGISLWGTMIFIVAISFQKINLHQYTTFLCILCIYFAFHLFIAQSSPISIGLILANILLYICITQIKLSHKSITKILICIFILNIIIGYNEIITSFISPKYGDTFSGIFQNSNTNGLFASCVLVLTLLFVDSPKKRYCIIGLFLIYLFTCKSRNVLLFCITSFGFYQVLKSKYSKYTIPLFLLFVFFSMYYLMVIELREYSANIELFGKKAESAGRSVQILITTKHFDLSLFGEGVEIPNKYSIAKTNYAIHNLYINSIYSMGIIYMILYIFFIYRYIYSKLKSNIAKSFLLSFHIYYMFEPGTAFSTGMGSLALLTIILKINQEQTNEDSTLYL